MNAKPRAPQINIKNTKMQIETCFQPKNYEFHNKTKNTTHKNNQKNKHNQKMKKLYRNNRTIVLD